MLEKSREKLLFPFSFLAATFVLGPAQAGGLAFSAPQHLATLRWAETPTPGVSPLGPDALVIDRRGRFWLEEGRTFSLYQPNGRLLQTGSPLEEDKSFFGFTSLEALPNGGVALLERLETARERHEKMNFEVMSKPGAQLILLDEKGSVTSKKTELDPEQPHSKYVLQNGGIYSVHDDGTFTALDALGAPVKDGAFAKFASVADEARWNAHVKTLPVFHATSRYYHDQADHLRVDKNAKFFLLGKPFVDGTAPFAERGGKIYNEVVCYPQGNFTNWIFVEDPAKGTYALIELITADEDLSATQDHTVFVDSKGDVIEGVAKDDGYRIYEWKVLK
jgi:hypothetical protein